MKPLMTTDLPLPLFSKGKVRETYRLGPRLLMIATDRLSAFDVILPTPIPGKGRVLTQMSRFWFEMFQGWLPHHMVSVEWEDIERALTQAGVSSVDRDQYEGRSMLVQPAAPFPVECVVRGYLAGSLWKEYQKAGGETAPVELHGHRLPGGLRESERLSEPIFTPATKAQSGHDENISFEQMSQIIGNTHAQRLRELSLRAYQEAADYALGRGIIIADTKFEFGLRENEILLIDEALTPDSSRFWEAALYEPGHAQPSYDKQFTRDYLETLDWDKTPPGPELPEEIARKTAEKYQQALLRLTA